MCRACERLEPILRQIYYDVYWEYDIERIEVLKCLPSVTMAKLYIRPAEDGFWEEEYTRARLKGHLENVHGYKIFEMELIATENVINLSFGHVHYKPAVEFKLTA